MGISKKIKKRVIAKKAPLSAVDNFIYGISFPVVLLLCFAPMIVTALLRRQLAFDEPALVAYDGNIIETFWAFPLVFVLIFVFVVPWGYALSKQQPILGNPKYKPPVYQPIIPTYPLFSKAFRTHLSKDLKDSVKRYILYCLIFVLLTAPVASLSLFPRKVILQSDQFVSYNSFNRVEHSAGIEEAEQIEISVTRKKSQYGMTMSIQFKGESYQLHLSSFPHQDIEETLEYMIHLKSFFDERECKIRNTHWMDSYIAEDNFTSTEIALIYELFDYTP